ncbi:NYN domain-containing protein [Pararhodobacter oceanensis]|uniref:Maebl n=1 Tax=Pararhodobacter oceanensis TaxID=2172121 RepID=A0A2T8HXQ2_9RHOB|nr:NYN domain-containing protein [Pararhodobacter oceanensis]PVH30193.1 Maebl [Pararhodobacter oceanensis]
MARPDVPLLAVLVDADNSSPRWAEPIFDEITSLGEASVRRIYGDFSRGQMAGWNEKMPSMALVPHHQPANTVGKNSSDIALVIDAMDLLHSGRFDGFVLVSSDSDFTRLASRIREQGLDVYGIGERKTPEAFRKACKRFIFIENLISQVEAKDPEKFDPPSKAIPLINNAMQAIDPDQEWFHLGTLGQTISANHPDFDSRNYGSAKLSDLITRAGRYETRRTGNVVEVRRKD